MGPLILASASPRRAQLLEQMGLEFRVCPVDLDETPLAGEAPADYVRRLARAKALAGRRQAGEGAALVLGSDTSVVLDGVIMGKPADRAGAEAMLARLSGRWHQVMTGVALAAPAGCEVRLSVTDVQFRTLEDAEIKAYCATAEPLDKAGAYGIQGRGGIFVASISGSYSGVMGLPLQETAELLAWTGAPVWQHWIPQAESRNE